MEIPPRLSFCNRFHDERNLAGREEVLSYPDYQTVRALDEYNDTCSDLQLQIRGRELELSVQEERLEGC